MSNHDRVLVSRVRDSSPFGRHGIPAGDKAIRASVQVPELGVAHFYTAAGEILLPAP